MVDGSGIRPEAIEALIEAIAENRPAKLLALGPVTTAERRAGEHAAAEVLGSTRANRSRRVDALVVLADGGVTKPMPAEDAWALMDEDHRHALSELFDALPVELVPIVADWRSERGL